MGSPAGTVAAGVIARTIAAERDLRTTTATAPTISEHFVIDSDSENLVQPPDKDEQVERR